MRKHLARWFARVALRIGGGALVYADTIAVRGTLSVHGGAVCSHGVAITLA
jgi:hypothetical protein